MYIPVAPESDPSVNQHAEWPLLSYGPSQGDAGAEPEGNAGCRIGGRVKALPKRRGKSYLKE